MNAQAASGFVERPHTADWALEVWAPDLASLLEESARGMYSLMEARLQAAPRVRTRLALQAGDRESLLVAFLSELLYLSEQQRVGFDRFRLTLEGNSLGAELEGALLQGPLKPIKAVTFHNLSIHAGERGLETVIVFDV